MSYIITGVICLAVGYIIKCVLYKEDDKQLLDRKRITDKYLKARKENEELKQKIKDVANEETSTTIDDLITDLN